MTSSDLNLEALFRDHARRLYRLARRLSADAASAEDLVQETFLRAASHSHRGLKAPERAEPWLVRTLVNLARDRFRRDRVRRAARPQLALPDRAPDDPERETVARTDVAAALAKLPARRRAVVVLHEIEERDTAQIAALLGIRRATVRWHLAAGRKHLARLLAVEPETEDPR